MLIIIWMKIVAGIRKSQLLGRCRAVQCKYVLNILKGCCRVIYVHTLSSVDERRDEESEPVVFRSKLVAL